MNKFEEKFRKLEVKVARLQFFYGYNSYIASRLRKKLEIYKKVREMNHAEIGDQFAYSAAEIQKVKSGYYNKNTGVEENKKLIRVLTERIKADNYEKEHESICDLIEIGQSIDDINNGFEC